MFLAVGLLILAASCETLNVGGNGPFRFSVDSVSVTPDPIVAGGTGTATVNFTGVTGPFTFTFNFGAGVTPATQTVTVASGSTATVTFVTDFFLSQEAASRNITVSVTGTDGTNTSGGPVTDTFVVTGVPDQPPVINSVTFNADGTVTVNASDPDGDTPITITQTTAPAGATVADTTVDVDGSGNAVFSYSANDLFAGGGGTAGFTATANGATSAEETVTITLPGITLVADTIYAIPLQTSVAAGDVVTIVVATGDPASAFQYLTGVRVTAPTASGFAYEPTTFNVGITGGAAGDVDGFWTAMNPGGGFLLPPDNFIQGSDAGNGLTGIDFNVTPIGGSDVAAGEGALFNFGATFDTPGTYQLGFQDVNVVSRTYYQDANQAPDFFWGDITNDHAGVPNSVTVN
jgi:hypothetical protein